jgi:hypothetical protein
MIYNINRCQSCLINQANKYGLNNHKYIPSKCELNKFLFYKTKVDSAAKESCKQSELEANIQTYTKV